MSNVVMLGKGNNINLSKPDGSGLSKLSVGVGWDPVKSKGFMGFGGTAKAIDLDASIVMLDENKQVVDMVWWQKKISSCNAIRHSGDNQTGEGGGDDETIDINTAALPARVKYLVVTVNSFRRQHFDQVENAFCNIYDEKKQKLVQMNISEKGAFTGVILAVIERNEGEWKVKSIGKPTQGLVAGDMLPDIVGEL